MKNQNKITHTVMIDHRTAEFWAQISHLYLERGREKEKPQRITAVCPSGILLVRKSHHFPGAPLGEKGGGQILKQHTVNLLRVMKSNCRTDLALFSLSLTKKEKKENTPGLTLQKLGLLLNQHNEQKVRFKPLWCKHRFRKEDQWSLTQFWETELSELPENTGSAASSPAWPQTGIGGRDILEDINTSSSPWRRNAWSSQIKKGPNARPGAGKTKWWKVWDTQAHRRKRVESIVLRRW